MNIPEAKCDQRGLYQIHGQIDVNKYESGPNRHTKAAPRPLHSMISQINIYAAGYHVLIVVQVRRQGFWHCYFSVKKREGIGVLGKWSYVGCMVSVMEFK